MTDRHEIQEELVDHLYVCGAVDDDFGDIGPFYLANEVNYVKIQMSTLFHP